MQLNQVDQGASMFQRTIDDIVETLNGGGRNPRRCSVLIGAGCSRSAGIPLASEIVSEIKRTYRAAHARVEVKDYPNCMAALDMGVRRDLIGKYVDQAKINWAHIALAQLIDGGYVDRILTTNFDPLVSRACSLINVFPAVYDLAASHIFKPDQVSKRAIFHLHGQRDGFVLLDTAAEVQKHRKHIKPVFDDAHSGRVWVIVGYSGENDLVFDLISETKKFEYGLYWIGHKHTPPIHVSEKLLTAEKGAYFIGDWDADDFFVSLAQKMGCFPPKFVRQPFTYLKTTLARLSDYKAPHETGRFDVTARVRQELDTIIVNHESAVGAEYHFLAGEYDQVLALLEKHDVKKLSARDRYLIGWTCIVQGNQLHETAKEQESEKLYRQAIGKFRHAARMDGSASDALYNWGNVLFDLSLVKRHGAPEVMTRGGERLLQGAIGKYKSALVIDPTLADAHNNWGNALADLARGGISGDEIQLLNEALKHYPLAVPTSETPDVVYCNWGKALHDVARRTGTRKTFTDAFAKFELAAKYNSENYSVFLSWGNALSDAGRRIGLKRYFYEASKKYRRAAEIRPNDTAAQFNWAQELAVLAGLESGVKRKKLLRETASISRKIKNRRLVT